MNVLRKISNRLKAPQVLNGQVPQEPQFSSAFFDDPERAVIFMDNRFKNAIDQLLRYTDSGFLDPENTRLVFRIFPQSYGYIRAICETRKLDYYAFSANSDIPNLKDCLVIYPFNSLQNVRLINNRQCQHILLMHGESNKLASVKPLARIYDYLLVAGDIARQRLVESQIFSPHYIASGRVIKIGDSVMGDFSQITCAADMVEAALGYFPTWEGGNDDEDLSSLAYISPDIFRQQNICQSRHLVMRLHPHTGARRHEYRDYVKNFLKDALAQGFEVSYLSSNHPTELEVVLKEQFPAIKWYSSEVQPAKAIGLALVDVSALEAVMDAKAIPNFVFIHPDKYIAAPQSYWNQKAGCHIYAPDMKLPEDIYVKGQYDFENYRKFLFDYETPELETLDHKARFAWVSDYVKKHAAG